MKCLYCGKEMINTVGGCYHCPACGFGVDDCVFRTVTPVEEIPTPKVFGEQRGWICPVCGLGVAPHVDVCPCQSDWKITYGTATSLNGGGDSQLTVTSVNSEWNKYGTYTGSDVN